MRRNLDALIELLAHQYFIEGLVVGVVLLGVLLILSRTLNSSNFPGWASFMALGTIAILVVHRDLEPLELVGLGGAGLTGLVIDAVAWGRPRGRGNRALLFGWVIICLVVIWFTSVSIQADRLWIALASPIFVLVLAGSLWLVNWLNVSSAEILGPMIVVTILGVWVTVPETDMFMALVGTALPLGIATLAPIRSSTTAAGATILAGLLALLTVLGGEVRPFTIMGGFASMGLIPIVALLSIVDHRPLRRTVVLGIHVLYVVVVTRIVDWWASVAVTGVAGVVLLALSTAVLLKFGKGVVESADAEM